jgi:dihydropteroate synthase-like protein
MSDRNADQKIMAERLLLLTGHLAHSRLIKVMKGLGEVPFQWSVFDIGVQVAALMTESIITRRLPRPVEADRIIVPGRCRADLDHLSQEFGIAFLRGPDELVDLPAFLGRGGHPPDLSGKDIRIFSEIVDASALSTEAILARAEVMRVQGADVIDLGCLPDTPFPHLEEAVHVLKAAGHKVSVDSADRQELERGAAAGADYLLSLTEETLDIAETYPITPVLIGKPQNDLASLIRVAEAAKAADISFILDPILDPIHFGFAASLARYIETRRLLPDAEIMMGTGNLTELTEADTSGITAVLIGLCSELAIRNVLIVQVSPHTRRTVVEHDAARRLMYAARSDEALPKGYGAGLLQVHDLKPYPSSSADIASRAAEVRDKNFRIEIAEDGIHIYNRDIHRVARDAMSLFTVLDVAADGAHAFYLGTELAKAELAFALGKRYVQDEPLDFGCATEKREDDLAKLREAGHTLRARKSGAEDE